MVEAREIVDSYDSTLSDPFAYSDKYSLRGWRNGKSDEIH